MRRPRIIDGSKIDVLGGVAAAVSEACNLALVIGGRRGGIQDFVAAGAGGLKADIFTVLAAWISTIPLPTSAVSPLTTPTTSRGANAISAKISESIVKAAFASAGAKTTLGPRRPCKIGRHGYDLDQLAFRFFGLITVKRLNVRSVTLR
jgi:hypothetical protein